MCICGLDYTTGNASIITDYFFSEWYNAITENTASFWIETCPGLACLKMEKWLLIAEKKISEAELSCGW